MDILRTIALKTKLSSRINSKLNISALLNSFRLIVDSKSVLELAIILMNNVKKNDHHSTLEYFNARQFDPELAYPFILHYSGEESSSSLYYILSHMTNRNKKNPENKLRILTEIATSLSTLNTSFANWNFFLNNAASMSKEPEIRMLLVVLSETSLSQEEKKELSLRYGGSLETGELSKIVIDFVKANY